MKLATTASNSILMKSPILSVNNEYLKFIDSKPDPGLQG